MGEISKNRSFDLRDSIEVLNKRRRRWGDKVGSQKSKKPYVSIILPTYNRADVLGAAIESVLKQTYSWFELIVIDDGSTDHTEEIVNGYQDDRIRYYKLKKNGGQSKARNYGIKLSVYDYIAFEDSDDLWMPQKLELQLRAFEQADNRTGICYHKFRYDLGEGRECIMPDEKVDINKKSGDIYTQLLWDNLIGMPTLLIKKECIDKIGLFDESLKCLEDYDFILRISRHYSAVFIDRVLLEASYSITGVSGNSYHYLTASCMLVKKYKEDYLRTGMLNHRLEIILRDAEHLGIKPQIIGLLEKIMTL